MPEASALESRIRTRLESLRSRGLERTLVPPAGVDLSSNDYLGLATHPRIRAAFAAGIEREGCGSTGSRLLRGERAAFAAVESAFAAFKRTDRSLFFSSGYLANLAAVASLSEAGDVLFSDERNHASLIDGVRLSRAQRVVVPHNDVERLATLIERTPCQGVRFVIVESLYSMDGDLGRLREYEALCRSADAVLLVDEAHAVGLLGARGSGGIEQAGLDANACVSINTAGKALGVSGAFVAGPAWAIDYLVQRARPFVFSTAPPPAIAWALQASLDVLRDEPERRATLRSRAAHLRRRLAEAGFEVAPGYSPIVPLVVGDNQRAVEIACALQSAGFDARAIRPPTVPEGTARIRVSVNATLSETTLDAFVTVLCDVWRR